MQDQSDPGAALGICTFVKLFSRQPHARDTHSHQTGLGTPGHCIKRLVSYVHACQPRHDVLEHWNACCLLMSGGGVPMLVVADLSTVDSLLKAISNLVETHSNLQVNVL